MKTQIRQLLAIVARLQRKYPKRRFTLDGRLIGDLGEVLVEEAYEVVLKSGMPKHYDAETPDGRQVQIKATMKRALTFPADHVPDYYIGVRIGEDGKLEELFNGPGWVIADALRGRKKPKNNLHNVGISSLKSLRAKVRPADRIATRGAPSGAGAARQAFQERYRPT